MQRADLVAACQRGETFKYVLFWGHTPTRGLPAGTVGPWVFSQWWDQHPFEVDGERFATAEHFMMAEKARLMGDDAARERVLRAPHPGAAKRVGRQVTPWDDALWESHRSDVVVAASRAKFGQHPELREYLLGTGDRVLVEASPRDRIWGIGLGRNHADARNPSRWRGENLLGFALMEARAMLGST